MRRLDHRHAEFDAAVESLVAAPGASDSDLSREVSVIIERVRSGGDAELVQLTRLLDGFDASVRGFELPAGRVEQAFSKCDPDLRDAMFTAADRIQTYHNRQRVQDWQFTDAHGNEIGQRVTALQRVGIYVPGGKAAYPSTVLMNAIPARVAGVKELIMVVPTPGGELASSVLAAAMVAKVDRIFTLGGAQAIAALAYGTETVPAVDKIVGPGNRYVAEAKRQVFGVVGIDMIAGPSEIVIVADGSVPPEWAAMDLFAQAEHDEVARALLLSPKAAYLDAVAVAVKRLLPRMERRTVIEASLARNGALIEVRDFDQAAAIVNRLAPEHLHLAMADPDLLLPKIRNAGAIFLGALAAEVFGDYCAGPNHVLPTAGTARFSSPLGVCDFQKRTSLIRCTPTGSANLAKVARRLATEEKLFAHARSAALRLDGGPE